MLEVVLNGNGDDLNNYDSDDQEKQFKKKFCFFCDICDCFDFYDIEDCFIQVQMLEDFFYFIYYGSWGEECLYCEICEMFGYWVINCNDDEIF